MVKPLAQEEVTASGIIIPESAEKEQKAEGEIVALGNGEKISKLGLSVGQKVVYGQYSGSEVEVDQQEYKILNHDDILAVIE